MDLEAFEDALAQHGPDLHLWPDALKKMARALLDHSEQARQIHADELRLCAVFAMQHEPKAPPDLVDRILAKAKASGPKQTPSEPLMSPADEKSLFKLFRRDS